MKDREPSTQRLRFLTNFFKHVCFHTLNEKEGVSFLLAEQNTFMALRYARYGYILENGRVVLDGDAEHLRENEDVKEFYLGIGDSGRRSFRDVKHYKRRKRWLA
jgi:branched-chain amino acid transport system ATP-binding protein